ncbi:hypothetical protein D1O33_00470 [Rhodococcus rhodochrous]|nr:hypothetical protein D1O33_00470 [Rhodococcus rhodochrous]
MSGFDLNAHEKRILLEACRVADRLDNINDHLAVEPLDKKLLTEARMQGHHLTRLLASLRMPEVDEDGNVVRAQRRGGARGTYA